MIGEELANVAMVTGVHSFYCKLFLVLQNEMLVAGIPLVC